MSALVGAERALEPAAFVARQPICDRALRVIGYELLFRDADGDFARITDPDAASSRTILTTLTEIGLPSLVGDRLAFLNVTRRLLLGDFAALLPPERVALEVLENVVVDDDLVTAVAMLAHQGYLVALDDFVYRDELRPLLEVASVVKLDVKALDAGELERHLRLLRPFDVRLLAEKIETQEQFEELRDRGFHYFQGYFFSRPQNVRGRAVPEDRLSRLRLVAVLQRPDLEFDELHAVISADLGLSYRLLRYINSAYFTRRHRLASVREALTMLGVQRIRLWATLIVLAGMTDSPSELIVTAMLRAKLCELLAGERGHDPDAAFTTGLLSALEALAGAPMGEVLELLPLSEEVADALLHHDGPLGEILRAVLLHEEDGLSGLSPEIYLQAVAWVEASRGVVVAAR